LTVTFEGEGAGYKNSLGWYKIAEDGSQIEPHLIWHNVSGDGGDGWLSGGGSMQVGESATIDGLSSGDRIGFFLIQKGATRFPQLDDLLENGNQTLSFDDAGNLNVVNSAGDTVLKVPTRFIFNTGGADQNPDGILHTVSGINDAGSLEIGFEDQTRGGDHDYNDVKVSIDYDGAGATHDSFSFTVADSQGYQVSLGDDGTVTFNISIDSATA
jgi:hypothetical protein